MAIDKRLQIYDEQGNLVDYDILASDVKFLPDGKDLPTKLAEMQDAIEDAGSGDGTVTGVKIGSTTYEPTDGVVDLSSPMSDKVDKNGTDSLMTAAEHTKLAGIAAGAQVNVINGIKVNGTLQTPDTEGNVDISVQGGEVPTKVSELENDEGYITAEEVGDIVATTGDIAIVETSGYVDIMIYSPEMSVKLGGNEVSSLAFFSDPTQQESLSLAVSGSHLKANIVATLEGTDANKFSISGSPITPSGGAASGTLTVAYTGTTAAGQSASATLKLTCGDLVKTISLHYAYASGPFISVNPASLSFKAATGSTETKTFAISASQLTGDVVVSTPSGSAFQVCATENGTYGNSVTVAKADAEAGKTIYVKYTAGSSAASANVTVSSTDATSRTVALSGEVSTISVSKQSMTFSTGQGVAVTDTFTVEGTNLREAITIAASGAGFSVSPQTIDNIDSSGTVASTTVTVTYQPSAAGTNTGSISIQSSGVSKTITLSGTASAIPEATSENSYQFTKDGIYYKVRTVDGQLTDTVSVYNSSYNTSSAPSNNPYSGNIEIPSTVTAIVDGVVKTLDVVSISAYAFSRCNGLVSLKIPDSVTQLSGGFLQNDSINFKSLIIGNGATSIPNYVSMTGKGMTYIELGESISSFGGTQVTLKLGSSCTMVLKHNAVVTLNNNSIFDLNNNNPSGATLKVPSALVDTYKAAKSWGVSNNYGWHAFNPDNITAIDE